MEDVYVEGPDGEAAEQHAFCTTPTTHSSIRRLMKSLEKGSAQFIEGNISQPEMNSEVNGVQSREVV